MIAANRLCAALGLLLLLVPGSLWAAADAAPLLARANAFQNYQDAVIQMNLQVFRDDQLVVDYGMTVQKLNAERMHIEFLRPAREKGREVLRVGDKMWMFLPDLGKPIVLSARQSFLGTGFANADLMRTDLVADYVPTVLRDEPLDGGPATVLELKAKGPEVAYDRILLWVDQTTGRPIRQELYTLSGKRLKTITYSKPTRFGSVSTNTEMVVESALTPREKSVITVTGLIAGAHLSESLFQRDSFNR